MLLFNPYDLYRAVSDDTKAWEVTRNINTARYPLCADSEARSRLPDYLETVGFHNIDDWARTSAGRSPANIEGKKSCKYCRALRAMFKKYENLKRSQDIEHDFEFWQLPEDERAPLLKTSHLRLKSTTARTRTPLHRQTGQPSTSRNDKGDVTSINPNDGHYYQAYSRSGPSTASWDAWKSVNWDLATHAGFFTWPHHDGSGFPTYVHVRVGCKIWGILRPKITESDTHRSHIFDRFRDLLRASPAMNYQSGSDLFNVFLLPGDVL